MNHKIEIRPEAEGDRADVRRVEERAFGRRDEADLVDALRAAGAVLLSLVAKQGDALVGHILFSPVVVDTPAESHAAVGLAPMAVEPSQQRTGIGSRLVREGLERLRAQGHGVVIVLGHPAYYPRFGFAPASRFGLRWEHDCPDEAFMALALQPGALVRAGGIVRFHREFGALG